MSIRLPLWLSEAARNFDADDKEWYQDKIVPLIEKRSIRRQKELGLPPLPQTKLQNVLFDLKVFLMRQYGSSLISSDFKEWFKSMENHELVRCDRLLLEIIKEQQHSPQELLKIQREMEGKLERPRNRKTTVDKECVVLPLLKPAMSEVLKHASQRGKKRKLQVVKEREMSLESKNSRSPIQILWKHSIFHQRRAVQN